MKCTGITLIVALLHTVTGQRSPMISYISPDQIKYIGGVVELKCSVQYSGNYQVKWMKKNGMDSTWISTGPSLDVRDSRFSIRYDRTDESTYILQIKDLQETDASTYECQVVLSLTNEVIKEVKLQVHKQPSISYNSTHSKVAAIGDEVELECYADGIPAPEITWRRENDAVLPTGGLIYRGNIFKIPSVAKEDRGNYYCIADNGVGRKKKHRVNIEVEFAPVVVAKGSRLGQALKYHTNLECHIEAYPPPVITWHKDGVQLTDNQHYTILSFSPTNQNIGTTLHITTIEKRHYGDYLCKAKNKVGNAEAKVELIICPPACGQIRYRSGALPLSTSPMIALFLLIATILRAHFLLGASP